MRYRITDLLLFVATVAIVCGWREFLLQDLTLEWYERHPVIPVTRIVAGQEVVTHQRVLMYYADDQFCMPGEFAWLTTRFYLPRLLQFTILLAGTVAIVIIAFRRWPKPLWQTTKLLCVLLLLAILLIFF